MSSGKCKLNNNEESYLLKWLLLKKPEITSAGENVEKGNPWDTVGRFPQKLKEGLT